MKRKKENNPSFAIYSSAFTAVEDPRVDSDVLLACFDSGVNEDLVKELARFEPLRVVFRDTGFVSDAVNIAVKADVPTDSARYLC